MTDELFGNHQNVWTALGDSNGARKHSLLNESVSLSRVCAFGSSETRKLLTLLLFQSFHKDVLLHGTCRDR